LVRTGNLPKGIDCRGAGGWTVAPGAVFGPWQWVGKGSELRSAPPVPPWIVSAGKARRNGGDTSAVISVSQDFSSKRERAWAEAALRNEAQTLATTPSGNRSVTLNTSAFRLGTMISRGWIGQHTVEGALLDACLSNHLAQDDGRHAVVATIRSGLEAGLKQPHADLPNREWQPANGAKEPYPVAETKTESDGEISLPAGVICDGAKEPAPRPKLIDGLLSATGLVFLGGKG